MGRLLRLIWDSHQSLKTEAKVRRLIVVGKLPNETSFVSTLPFFHQMPVANDELDIWISPAPPHENPLKQTASPLVFRHRLVALDQVEPDESPDFYERQDASAHEIRNCSNVAPVMLGHFGFRPPRAIHLRNRFHFNLLVMHEKVFGAILTDVDTLVLDDGLSGEKLPKKMIQPPKKRAAILPTSP